MAFANKHEDFGLISAQIVTDVTNHPHLERVWANGAVIVKATKLDLIAMIY
jgi:hypothetical protein